MKDDTDKHGLIVNIGNIGNTFITTVKPHLNSYFNEPINFYGPFKNIIVRDNTGFSLRYYEMNSYELPLCYSKRKFYITFFCNCGLVMGIKKNQTIHGENLRFHSTYK